MPIWGCVKTPVCVWVTLEAVLVAGVSFRNMKQRYNGGKHASMFFKASLPGPKRSPSTSSPFWPKVQFCWTCRARWCECTRETGLPTEQRTEIGRKKIAKVANFVVPRVRVCEILPHTRCGAHIHPRRWAVFFSFFRGSTPT